MGYWEVEEQAEHRFIAIYRYYPSNKYPNDALTAEEVKHRREIWDFKDGKEFSNDSL